MARKVAEEICGDKVRIRALLRELFGEDVEVRKRAADVSRRITERDGRLLESYADELAGLLENTATGRIEDAVASGVGGAAGCAYAGATAAGCTDDVTDGWG